LLRPLAEQGDAVAQNYLGLMYERGQGVPQNYVQAVSWYRKAAEQGDALAQFDLGFMYSNGQGVPPDYVQAHMWFNLAASRETNPERRSARVKARDLIAAKMTREQIAEAQQLALEWKPKGK
jgi:TPR repeat protein